MGAQTVHDNGNTVRSIYLLSQYTPYIDLCCWRRISSESNKNDKLYDIADNLCQRKPKY